MNFKKLITAMAGTALVLTPALSVTACNNKKTPDVVKPEPDKSKVMSLKAISVIKFDTTSEMIFPNPKTVSPDQLRLFFDPVIMMNVRNLGGAASTAVKNTDYSYTLLTIPAPGAPLLATMDLTAAAELRTFIVTITSQNQNKLTESTNPITVVLDPMLPKADITGVTVTTVTEAKAKATIDMVDNEYKQISGTVVRALFAILVREAVRAIGTQAVDAVEYTDYTFTLKQNGIDVDANSNYNFSSTDGLTFTVTINSIPNSKFILGNSVPLSVVIPQLVKN